ncbi:MAG: DUF2812 domain-containing protein [Ethanoligenens sp.]
MDTKLVWKWFLEDVREENWLNRMVSKGWAMKNRFGTFYTFESCEKGAYIYRIELLKEQPESEDSVAYIRFLEQTGVDYVAHSGKWVYFRKKAADGPFQLYTDADSKIRHFKRIFWYYTQTGILELSVGMMVLGNTYRCWVEKDADGFPWFWLLLICGIVVMAVGVLFISLIILISRKIKHLEKEKQLHEA